MASGQLPEFIRNDQLTPDAPEPWNTVSGCDVGGLSQAPSKTQINYRTQRSDRDSLPQELINKAVKSFTL